MAVIGIALFSLGLTSHAVQGAAFETWLDALRDEARSIGISEETVSEALQGLVSACPKTGRCCCRSR